VLAKRNEREIAQQQSIQQIFSRAAFARPAKRQMHKTHTPVVEWRNRLISTTPQNSYRQGWLAG
jgi:hypothetical protein